MSVDYTFERPSPATVVDHEGIIRNCKIDEARFQGARRVENLCHQSNNLDQWTKSPVSVVTPGTDDWWILDPGTQGVGDAVISTAPLGISPDVLLGRSFSSRLELKCGSADDFGTSVRIQLNRNTGGQGGTFTTCILPDNLNDSIIFYNTHIPWEDTQLGLRFYIYGGDYKTLHVRNCLIEEVTGQSIEAPSEYVSNGMGDDHGCGVDGVKYFPYKNGNTVDEDGVVTEKQGSAIKDVAYLNEAASTNLLHFSEGGIIQYSVIGGTPAIEDGGNISTNISESVLFPMGMTTGQYAYFGVNFDRPNLDDVVTLSFLVQREDGLEPTVRYLDSADALTDVQLLESASSVINRVVGWSKTLYEGTTWRYDVQITSIGSGSGSTGFVKYIGNRDETPIRIAAFQFEVSPAPTSYIPTDGVAVARAADALSYTGVNVHEDFVAGCDVTPLFDGDGLADSAGRMFGTEDSGTDEVLSIGSNAPGFTGSGGGGTFDIDKSVLIGDTRTKRVFTLGEDAMIYADGSQVYSNASGITPDHTDMSIYQVGRFNTDVLPCLYHAFQLFDQPLTDEQLVNLSKPGTNPKGCS